VSLSFGITVSGGWSVPDRSDGRCNRMRIYRCREQDQKSSPIRGIDPLESKIEAILAVPMFNLF
jgi:hypothetical protein